MLLFYIFLNAGKMHPDGFKAFLRLHMPGGDQVAQPLNGERIDFVVVGGHD